MEINGVDGYGIITGRNRSYGHQRYINGKRWGWLDGVNQRESEYVCVKTNGEDVFEKETEALLFPLAEEEIKPCSSQEALENMKLLEDCYNILKRF